MKIQRDKTPKSRQRSTAKKTRAKRRSSAGDFAAGLRRFFLSLILRLALWSALFTVLLVAGYAVYLDRIITETFEGRRWSVPAQIYAQPIELYPGAPIRLDQLTAELNRLGYRTGAMRTPGEYQINKSTVSVYLRSFPFIDTDRPAQRIAITYRSKKLSQIRDEAGKDVSLIRLDPANIGSFFPSHGEDRIVLMPEQVPPLLADGLKAIEDKDFDNHRGFSISGILRAAWVNLRAGERQQGGSTLTQQLVKSYFLTNERTFSRKLREIAMAVLLEIRFSKQDLLTAYINEIYLGQNGARAIHGFGLGAQYYFNKRIGELRVQEIATLISIIRGPSYYNPFRFPERALRRRNRILDTFLAEGIINGTTHRSVIGLPLDVVASPNSGGSYYPAFMDLVRAELSARYSSSDLRSNGLRIFTTLQPLVQENAQQAVSQTLTLIENDYNMPDKTLQAAALISDTQTGEVLALVGGRQGRVDGFNRVLNAQRSVGSVIKPLTVLTGLESGLQWTDRIDDEPISLVQESGETWQPSNADGKFMGSLPIYLAMARSQNLAMVNLGLKVGLERIQQRFTSLLGYPPTNPYPSFLLGAEPFTPLRLSELYSNFASGGFRTPPKSVVTVLDERGEALSHHPFSFQQTIDPDVANSLNRGLELVMHRGTGRASSYAESGIAGKTGTTNDQRDSWFAGFDNSSLAVFWVGRDDNAPTPLTGSTGALRLWDAFTDLNGIDPIAHAPVDDLAAIEYRSGLLAKKSCADVIELPVRGQDTLPTKPGCSPITFGQRLRALIRN